MFPTPPFNLLISSSTSITYLLCAFSSQFSLPKLYKLHKSFCIISPTLSPSPLPRHSPTSSLPPPTRNSSFNLYLQCEPMMKLCVQDLLASRFSPCFEKLKLLCQQLQLDVYISPHIDTIYRRIRDRAFIQVGVVMYTGVSAYCRRDIVLWEGLRDYTYCVFKYRDFPKHFCIYN